MKTLITSFTLLFVSICIAQTNGFKFKIKGNNYSDETIIRLMNNATNDFDGNFDAWKLFSNNPNVPSIYSKTPDNYELSINSLPEYTKDTSITIYTDIPTNGTYIIEASKLFPTTNNYKFSLTDISSTIHFSLLNDTTLSFNFNTQQNSPSFTFNISTPANANTNNETCVNSNDGEIIIENKGNNDWGFSLYKNNLLIANKTVNLSNDTISQLDAGNYKAYVNSKGITDTLNLTIAAGVNLVANFELSEDTIYLSEGGFVSTLNYCQNAQSYLWDFGDGNINNNYSPSNTYSNVGSFDVTLSVNNNQCSKELKKTLIVEQYRNVSTDIYKNEIETNLIKHKNNLFTINTNQTSGVKHFSLYNLNGQLIKAETFAGQTHQVNLTNVSNQLYIIKVVYNNRVLLTEKILIN